jgi:gliding motility-associated lipoprotein GldH
MAIQDTAQAYDIYLLLQYTPDYPYQNLHIQYQLQNEQAQITSTFLTNHLLFDPKTGKPLGKGWGKKKCLKLPLITNYHFEKSGDYSLALVQFMRTEQLPGIASVGIQLCKSQPKTH